MKLDIIGDIHGCFDEFQQLTILLGYDWESGIPIHREGRMLAFVDPGADQPAHYPTLLNSDQVMGFRDKSVRKYSKNHRRVHPVGAVVRELSCRAPNSPAPRCARNCGHIGPCSCLQDGSGYRP